MGFTLAFLVLVASFRPIKRNPASPIIVMRYKRLVKRQGQYGLRRMLLCRRNPCYTAWIMSTPEPELRWYQFSLRSLLLLTVAVAGLCSLGVCTDWSIAAVIGGGGVIGGIIARTRSGLLLGVAYGVGFSGMAAAAYVLTWFSGLLSVPGSFGASWQVGAAVKTAAVIGSLVGGIAGGRAARRRLRP